MFQVFHSVVSDSLNLGFEEEPDYAMMRGMCRDYADRNHFHMDNMYASYVTRHTSHVTTSQRHTSGISQYTSQRHNVTRHFHVRLDHFFEPIFPSSCCHERARPARQGVGRCIRRLCQDEIGRFSTPSDHYQGDEIMA